jgi:hypothetical protein
MVTAKRNNEHFIVQSKDYLQYVRKLNFWNLFFVGRDSWITIDDLEKILHCAFICGTIVQESIARSREIYIFYVEFLAFFQQ